MKNKQCYLCHRSDFATVQGRVRDIPTMRILRCRNCGLVFLEDFSHIDDKFYEDSKMRINEGLGDWKRYLRTCSFDDERRARWLRQQIKDKSVLDYGCGAGGFLLKIKDTAKECVGVEKDNFLRGIIETKFRIDVYADIKQINQKFDIITLFHVLEHFTDPAGILKNISSWLKPKGFMLIEVPNINDALLSLYNCKAFSEFTYWGCHLYSFNIKTLSKVILKAGLVINNMKQIQRYPVSNHLYWLTEGKPGGHLIWDFLNSEELSQAYQERLSSIQACDTLVVSVAKRGAK